MNTAIAAFPSGGDYVDALQDTARCFRDPHLVGCSIELTKLHLPRAISGNFASVFVATTAQGRRFAVKCFTRDVADQHTRYQEISAALGAVPAAWKVDFRYVEDGVMVRGRPYPILVMEWVSARQLIPWIEANLGNPAAFADLAGKFATMVADLEAAGIAHGDLQHGNLLVTPHNELKLIDYDGMYVPALQGLPAVELGQPNYQHPRRGNADYGPWLDRFSARLVHVSLLALAADPGLWAQLHKPGGEYLLLHRYDLDEPASSPGFSLLEDINPLLRAQVGILADLIRLPLDAIPPLDGAPPAAPTGTVSAGTSWLKDAPAGLAAPAGSTVTATSSAAVGSGSWLDDHVPPPTPVALGRPSWPTRVGWYLHACLLALLLSAAALTPAALPFLIILALITLIPWRIRFAFLPPVRARKAQQRLLDQCRHDLRNAQKDAERLSAQSAAARDASQRELRTLTERKTRTERDFQAEYTRIDRNRDGELAKLMRERAGLDSWKTREVSQRTAAAERAFIADRLSRHSIESAGVFGVGRGVAASLASCGIRTAADFTAVQHTTVGGGAQTIALMVRSDGKAFKVPNVGEARATSLLAWREALVADALRAVPRQQAAAIRRQVDADAAVRQASITSREQAVSAAAGTQRQDVAMRAKAQREDLVTAEQQLRSDQASLAASLDRSHAGAVLQSSTTQRRMHQEQRALDAYKGIAFRKYVRALMTGGC
jgi:hypothetical protein